MNKRKHTNNNKVDLLSEQNLFQFKVHNQGIEETCVAHAFTATHEIYLHKYLNCDDLLEETKWMGEIGALMMHMAKKIELTGQREKPKGILFIYLLFSFIVFY